MWNADANHGRYGFEDYPGLETVIFNHSSLKAGDGCPGCVEALQSGRLYEDKANAGSIICLMGKPIITGTRYKITHLRCSLCGETYKAEVPEELKKQPKYSESAISALAINHYYLGLPFKRIETYQASLGVPLADATQYTKMENFEKLIAPVCRCLEVLAAEGDICSYDDTSMRLLEMNRPPFAGRKGIYSTAIVSECIGAHTIYLFNTSRANAGETMDKLLKHRESQTPLITMRDALSQNNLSDVDETLLVKLVIAFCLVHGRRKFYELLDTFPTECEFVLECIAKVYRHEAHCKKEKLTPDERLFYHQTHSQPVMSALWEWLNNQWQYHGVEHNSALGKAVKYMLRHWVALTEFLRTPSCPMDNSHCEQTIKIFIRYRKNSLFYRTLKGAAIGDALMSVIHTAIRNKINAFEYLNVLQLYSKLVAEEPHCWLPWNYKETLLRLELDKAA